ncbi:OprO/OprP family phosphate-selective porin [Planctomycetaceae bacterium SH139]
MNDHNAPRKKLGAEGIFISLGIFASLLLLETSAIAQTRLSNDPETPLFGTPAAEVPISFRDGPQQTTAAGKQSAEGEGEGNGEADGDEKTEGEKEEKPDIEELSRRLAEMEESWSEFQEKVADEKAAKAKKPSTTINGRVHLDYWSFLDNDPAIGYFENPNATLNGAPNPRFGLDPEDRFVFRRIRLEAKGDVPGNMSWRIQIDFNRPATPEYKDVFIAWDDLPLGQRLILGNQKRPIGLDHLNSSRFNVFAERPLAVEAFNEDARRIGLAMYGYDEASSLHWRYGVYNLENTATSGRYIGESLQVGGYGRLSSSPWYDEISGGRGYQHLAIAGSIARPDGDATAGESNSNEARFRTRPAARSNTRWLDTGRIAGAEYFEQVGVESITNIGALQITGEYLATFVQRDLAVGPETDLAFHGGYIYASYFLTGEHVPYNRASGTLDRVKPFENFFLVDRCRGGLGRGWGALQLAFRYDYLDLSDNDILGGVESNYTMGLNWHWTAYSKVQTNLTYGTITDHRPVVDPNTNIAYTEGDFWILGSRFMIDF